LIIMKTKTISLLIVFVMLILSGCEEFTDTEPTTSISAEGMIYDEASAKRVMNGVYSAMQVDNGGTVYGGYMRMVDGVYADNVTHTGSYPDVAELWGNDAISSNLFIDAVWEGHYLVVYRANKLIEGLEKLGEEDITTETKNALIAEAKFLRALIYFRLVNYFGDVPLVTESLLDDLSNKDHPRNSTDEVYAQIKQDIEDAESNVMDMGAPFRVSPEAVQALKAKVYLYTGDYGTALSAASNFAYSGDSPIGALASNYADVFDESMSTSEDIYKILFTKTDGNNLAWFLHGPPARGEVGASESLRNAFEQGDERAGLIHLTENTWYIEKYADVAGGADYPHVFRLADMYLIYAEALIRANSDYAGASTYVNYVRNRAGLDDVTLTSDNWEDIILKERRLELYAEGERWLDVKRFGVAEEVISSKPSVTFANVRNKYLLWPIPQNEIDANEQISPADQNPGY
jgi:hypothetical protein